MYFELFDDYWPGFRNSFATKFIIPVHGEYYRMPGEERPFAKVYGPPRKQSIQIHEWLDRMISQPDAAQHMVRMSRSVDFEDARVRAYTEEELEINRKFLEVGTSITGLNYFLKVGAFFFLFPHELNCHSYITLYFRLSPILRIFRIIRCS